MHESLMIPLTHWFRGSVVFPISCEIMYIYTFLACIPSVVYYKSGAKVLTGSEAFLRAWIGLTYPNTFYIEHHQ